MNGSDVRFRRFLSWHGAQPLTAPKWSLVGAAATALVRGSRRRSSVSMLAFASLMIGEGVQNPTRLPVGTTVAGIHDTH